MLYQNTRMKQKPGEAAHRSCCTARAGGFLCAWICLAVGSNPAAAELIYFVAGGQAHIPASVDGNIVRVDAPDGMLTFQRSEFRKIVPGYRSEEEWAQRKAQAQAAGAPERFAAAWWALENGLTSEAESMLRQALESDAHHQPTARLVAVLDRLQTLCAEPDIESLRASLSVPFELARGPHVLLLHQHTEAEARERIDLIERVLKTLYLVLAAQGIDLPAPRVRLVSVWFARQADYLAYLHAEQSDAFRTTSGFYHPTRDAVLAYDLRGGEPQSTSSAALIARRKELSRAQAQLREQRGIRLNIEGAPSRVLSHAEAFEVLDRLGRDVDRRQLLLDLERRSVNLGTAAHETVHQLVALTRLAPRHADFPLWLHEGFAAQFEVVRGGRWAGFSRAHDARLPDWRKLSPAPRLAALLRDEGFGQGYQRDLYAEAWSLVYYLRKQHPDRFITFLDLLRAPHEAVPSSPERTLAAFRSAFGEDLIAIETSWHQFMSKINTPLESERPAP
jgi:Protein of unknown function (DUF1570)